MLRRLVGFQISVYNGGAEATMKNHMSCLGEYFLKCTLDVFMPLSGGADSMIGNSWPTKCPGYVAAAGVLAPNLPADKMMAFLHYIFRRDGACKCLGMHGRAG